jgi:hypothetical protein
LVGRLVVVMGCGWFFWEGDGCLSAWGMVLGGLGWYALDAARSCMDGGIWIGRRRGSVLSVEGPGPSGMMVFITSFWDIERVFLDRE